MVGYISVETPKIVGSSF